MPSSSKTRSVKEELRATLSVKGSKGSTPLAKLELIAILCARDAANFWNYLAPSLALFWPSANVLAILDDTPEDRAFAATLPFGYQVAYNKEFSDLEALQREFSDSEPSMRGQFAKFFADLYTDAEYIGFIDSDAFLTTWVTESAIFEGVQPRVIGEIGRPRAMAQVDDERGIAHMLRQPSFFTTMSYFPQVHWRFLLPALRKHIEDVHGMDFMTVLKRRTKWHGNLAELVLLNHVALLLFPKLYSFHLREVPGWHASSHYPAAARGVRANVTESLRNIGQRPAINVAVHGPYMGFEGYEVVEGGRSVSKCNDVMPLRCRWFRMAAAKMLNGFCRVQAARSSIPLDLCPMDPHMHASTLHKDLFRFENHLQHKWGLRPQRAFYAYHGLQRAHYAEVAHGCCGPDEKLMRRILELARLGAEQLYAEPSRLPRWEWLAWADLQEERDPYFVPKNYSRKRRWPRCTAGLLEPVDSAFGMSRGACCPMDCVECTMSHCQFKIGGHFNCCPSLFNATCTSMAGPPPCIYPKGWGWDWADQEGRRRDIKKYRWIPPPSNMKDKMQLDRDYRAYLARMQKSQ